MSDRNGDLLEAKAIANIMQRELGSVPKVVIDYIMAEENHGKGHRFVSIDELMSWEHIIVNDADVREEMRCMADGVENHAGSRDIPKILTPRLWIVTVRTACGSSHLKSTRKSKKQWRMYAVVAGSESEAFEILRAQHSDTLTPSCSMKDCRFRDAGQTQYVGLVATK